MCGRLEPGIEYRGTGELTMMFGDFAGFDGSRRLPLRVNGEGALATAGFREPDQ